MVVLHVASGGGMSGGIRQLIALLEAQKAMGLEVVLCASPKSPALAAAAGLGIPAHAIPFGNLWGQWKASRRLRQIARAAKADIVHTHHTKAHNAALLASLGGGFPPIVVKRAVLYVPKMTVKFTTRRVYAILTNSGAVRDVLAKVGVDPAKVRVVYNPRALPDLAPAREKRERLAAELGLDLARPIVGAVGNGTPDKGFQYLIEAAPLILEKHPEAQFLLVGPHTERLAPRVKELGLERRVTFTGFRSDAVDLMALFDLFAFTSVHKDTCPNVVLEALSLAVPVASSDLTGMEEILPPEAGASVFFRMGDPVSLAREICALLDDPERLRAMGEAGRRRIAAHHDPAAQVARIVDVYREAVAAHAPR